jgi:hypothetical protein
VAGAQACVEEATFRNGPFTLAGQWFAPAGVGPRPAVVLIRGSGPSRRGNPWTLEFVGLLVGEGFGVLVPDKRGSDGSDGDWRSAAFEDLAEDALAGVRFVRSKEDVDPGAVGLIGLSQGGQIAPIAAARSDAVAFVINVVGGAVPFVENVTFEMRNTFEEEGLEGERLEAAMRMIEESVRFVRGTVSWDEYSRARDDARAVLGNEMTDGYFIADPDHWRWEFFRRHQDLDPVDWWRQVEQPVLALYGAADANTPTAESVERLRSAFRETRHPDATVEVFPGLGHSLWDMSGPMAEHGLHPDVRSTLAAWLRRVVGGGG